MQQSPEPIYQLIGENIVWRQVGPEVMILDKATSTYLSVNETGSLLWPLLAEGATLSGLAAALAAAFDLDQATADEDAAAFLSSLQQKGMVQAR